VFNLFSKTTASSVDLAERIFEYRVYQPYVNECPDKDVRIACKNCKDIQDSLNKVIEYCGEPTTSRQKYLYAITYAWSRVIYNERAIYYLKEYLGGDLYSKYTSTKSKKILHLTEMYGYLIDCYTKDLKYDDALKVCEYFLNNICKKQLSIYYKKADILRRKNDLNNSILTYEHSKKYITCSDDLNYIDRQISDLKNKIQKKYIFKVKVKERKRYHIHSDEIFDLEI